MRRRLFTRRRRAADDQTDELPCADCDPGGRPTLRAACRRPTRWSGPTTCWPGSPGRLETVVDGQLLVFDPRSGSAHLLNTSAALVLTSVDGRATVGEIVDDLCRETGVDRERARPRRAPTRWPRCVHGGLVTWFFRDPDDGDPAPPTSARGGAGRSTRPLGGGGRAPPRRGVAGRSCSGPYRPAGAAVTARTDDHAVAAGPGPRRWPRCPAAATETASGGRAVTCRSTRDRWAGPAGTGCTPAGIASGGPTIRRGPSGYALAGLNRLAARTRPDRHLLVHAGAVERDGRVAIVTGISGRGKTTLTAALVRRGYGYVTDELVVVDPANRERRPVPQGARPR